MSTGSELIPASSRTLAPPVCPTGSAKSDRCRPIAGLRPERGSGESVLRGEQQVGVLLESRMKLSQVYDAELARLRASWTFRGEIGLDEVDKLVGKPLPVVCALGYLHGVSMIVRPCPGVFKESRIG